LLAQIYLENSRNGDAIDAILQGLVYCGNDRDLLLLKARTEAAAGPALAIPTLEVLHERIPGDTNIALELANIYLNAGQSRQGVSLLRDFLNHCGEKDATKVQTALAVALYRNGNKTEAIEKLDKLSSLTTDEKPIFLAEIQLLIQQQDWDALENKIENRYENKPDDIQTLSFIAGNLAKNQNKNARRVAEDMLGKILTGNPDYIPAMKILAGLLQSSERNTEAAAIYRQLLKIDPDDVIAINNLAWLMCEYENDYQQALELAQKGLRKNNRYLDLTDTRGVIYYRLGEHQKAIRDFTKCVELYPRNSHSLAVSHLHLAEALNAIGQFDAAADSIRKSLELKDEFGGLTASEVAEAQKMLNKLSGEKDYGTAGKW